MGLSVSARYSWQVALRYMISVCVCCAESVSNLRGNITNTDEDHFPLSQILLQKISLRSLGSSIPFSPAGNYMFSFTRTFAAVLCALVVLVLCSPTHSHAIAAKRDSLSLTLSAGFLDSVFRFSNYVSCICNLLVVYLLVEQPQMPDKLHYFRNLVNISDAL